MERPFLIDPTECTNGIRFLNGTEIPSSMLIKTKIHLHILKNELSKRKILEELQPQFIVEKLKTYHNGTFANSELVLDASLQKQTKIWDKYECNIEKDSCSLITREVEILYYAKGNVLIVNGHTLSCYHIDGFCKPTILTPYTNITFPQDLYLTFSVYNFLGRNSKTNHRHWLETEHFFKKHYALHIPPSKNTTNNYECLLFRFESLTVSQLFCNKTPLLSTNQYPDLFVTSKKDFL